MEILGIGASELLFILIIALIVLGPKDMQKAGKTIGRWLNQLVQSEGWKAFQKTSHELRDLPRKLMKEANMELQETERELNRALDPREILPASPPRRKRIPSNEVKDSPQPPSADSAAPSGGAGSAVNKHD